MGDATTTRPSTILFIATDAHGAGGGIAQYNRDVLDALSAFPEVAHVDVIARNGDGAAAQPPAKIAYPRSLPRGLLRYGWAMLRAVLGNRYDIIYCAHIRLLPFAVFAAFVCNAPLYLMIYGIDAWEPPSAWTKWLLRHVDRIASISAVTRDRFAAWAGPRAGEVALLPNAIDLDTYGLGTHPQALAARLGIDGGPVLLTFGRMSASERYKGFDEILGILPRLREAHPQMRYLLAGDGDDRERLEQKAAALGVREACVFTGYVAESDKADLFRLADLYAMPSSGEGFGFVVIEALACGTPVVASTTDGTFEAVRGGMLGQAVNPSDAEALIAAIEQALGQPKHIPDGLSYFAVPEFRTRLHDFIFALQHPLTTGRASN